MGIQICVASNSAKYSANRYQLSSYAMLNQYIIKQEDYVMFIIIISMLTTVGFISDRLTQPLFIELVGELLTTIPVPYNYL